MTRNSNKPDRGNINSTDWGGILSRLMTKRALPGETQGLDRVALDNVCTFCAGAMTKRAEKSPEIRIELLRSDTERRMLRVAVVNDDMPFLVDSITGVLAAHGIEVDRLLHPVLHVSRDESGSLIKLADQPFGSKSMAESLVYIEIERVDARERAALIRDLGQALAHVRAAVKDWSALRNVMENEMRKTPDEEAAHLLGWFLENKFTLLGACTYQRNGRIVQRHGVGRLIADKLLAPASRERAFAWFEETGAPLLAIKANILSSVHRRAPFDLILLPKRQGNTVVGLSVHAGLWTSAALATTPALVPVVRKFFVELREKLHFSPTSHTGKALEHAFVALPHDLMVSIGQDALEPLTLAVMSQIDRPRPQLVMVKDPLKRHVFAFVWMSRDDVTTQRRIAIGAMLCTALDAQMLNWSMTLGDEGPAVIRYTLDVRESDTVPDTVSLNAQLSAMMRGWRPAVEQQLARRLDPAKAARLTLQWADAFPAAYRIEHSPEEAAHDIMMLGQRRSAAALATRLTSSRTGPGDAVLTVYAGRELTLSEVVPVLENFGATVLNETSIAISGSAMQAHVHSFQLALPGVSMHKETDTPGRIETALSDVLAGAHENDAFNKLMLRVQVDTGAVRLFRALFRYLRQTGLSYGLDTVVAALINAPVATRALVALFRALHDPKIRERDVEVATASAHFEHTLDAIGAIDDDRILRTLGATIRATLRTNAFSEAAREALAFKFDCSKVPGLPAPRPWREIFVYSARVEGIHLRAGPVARGGLRWSDRRDDFRTEILGLMKAQRVKNAVIVPTGAKGGFYPKHLPPASERDAWLAEGTECYRIFIRSLLSLTDNIIGTRIVHPEHIVCHDGDDPYFVVAADKGTATFSDVANAIALERNFWLGDAFASGGSIGYDHKAMGITAKGAWVSVTRHCAEMGMDVQTDPVRVAGCGDMSGDVFGNGMLLSKSIRLVAAFDHRHIFLDPDPDPATSFAERKRLFKLPRSSWADYNPALISRGGGVFPRSAKSIVLSTQVRALLGVSAATLETNALISALLCAPVDVLWFGGIGTYIKASTENNADAGDRINDALRVSAAALQAKVIGEGANLALTQAARIEFAQRGGRINTDFIDNSAGVDCSDHEVNIKIALNTMLRDGQMQEAERRTLLARMTREVSTLVLEDNRLQTLALSIAEAGGPEMLPSFIHLIDHFEAHGQLDRAVEGIASNDEMMRRPSEMRMLTRPELAVLMSTAKLALQAAIERGALERDHGLDDELVAGFPELMHERAHDAIVHHRLRGPIIATQTANRIINRMGMVHPFELAEEEGVDLADVADAFLVCERLFDLPALWSLIEAARLSETVRIHLFEQVAIELRAQMADLLRNAVPDRTPSEAATELAPIVAQLSDGVDSLLPGAAIQQMERFKQRLHDMGVTRTLMARIVHLAKLDGAIGLASLALGQKGDIRALTQAFTALGAALGIDWVQGMAMEMTPSDPWERLLVAGLGRDFHAMRLDWLKRHAGRNPVEAVTQWIAQNRRHIDPFHNIIERAQMSGHTTLAMFAQLAGQARTLLKR